MMSVLFVSVALAATAPGPGRSVPATVNEATFTVEGVPVQARTWAFGRARAAGADTPDEPAAAGAYRWIGVRAFSHRVRGAHPSNGPVDAWGLGLPLRPAVSGVPAVGDEEERGRGCGLPGGW